MGAALIEPETLLGGPLYAALEGLAAGRAEHLRLPRAATSVRGMAVFDEFCPHAGGDLPGLPRAFGPDPEVRPGRAARIACLHVFSPL